MTFSLVEPFAQPVLRSWHRIATWLSKQPLFHIAEEEFEYLFGYFSNALFLVALCW